MSNKFSILVKEIMLSFTSLGPFYEGHILHYSWIYLYTILQIKSFKIFNCFTHTQIFGLQRN